MNPNKIGKLNNLPFLKGFITKKDFTTFYVDVREKNRRQRKKSMGKFFNKTTRPDNNFVDIAVCILALVVLLHLKMYIYVEKQ